MEIKHYYVYILCNKTRRLYVGITSNLGRRVWQHKSHIIQGFTKRYNIDQLVYFEVYEEPLDAICREKQIKKYRREKKIRLIELENPEWRDIAENLSVWDII